MNRFRVEFHAKADAETIGLPEQAFTALIDTLKIASRDPWAASHADDPNGDPGYRWAEFGRYGIVRYYADAAERVMRVHTVMWTG